MLNIYDFSIDYVIHPTLIRTQNLRFGWKLASDRTNVLQKNYRIVISDESGVRADTGVVVSGALFDIRIPNLILSSRTDYTVKVTVTDNTGDTAEYTQTVSTEILPDEWEAEWIKPEKHIAGWAPYLRTKFEVCGIKKAVMYACGLGCAEYYVNGVRTDDFMLDPPMTNYEKMVYYRRFEITDLLRDGGNALTVLLGEGFYSQSRVWSNNGLVYGDVCVKLRVEITLSDGTLRVITTNTDDWRSKYSPISSNNIYAGEIYDCRLETDGFADYDSSECGWDSVVCDETPKGILTPCLIPPVREIRRLPAKTVHCATGKEDGAWIFDLGENMAGIAEYRLPPSPGGTVYVFRYAENLNAAGQLDLRSTGASATQVIQQDMYICRGDKNGEVYRPRLTYHGFRFVEVTGFFDISEGYGKVPELSLVTGIQITTDMERTAQFHTSYEDLERLNHIMHNTFISNYHGFPEDCPAREKCGWLGDAEVVCNYGLLNYDSTSAYEKYLEDIRTTYETYGVWQMIAPGKRTCGEATPLWGCAQIIIPYYMYKYSGDSEVILQNFDLMEAWVQHEINRSNDYIITVGLGDWCPPGGNSNPRRMPVEHSSTLMFYEICIRMAELCKTFSIGNASYYADLANSIKGSFIRHFYKESEHSFGYWGTDGAALFLGLYPDGTRSDMVASLRERIIRDEFAMPTAIYANKYLVPVLCEEGLGDDALHFLFNREKSSFATMMDDNATTIWEQPDMVNLADTKASVSSYNHPMHGGFLCFITEKLCGLKPLKPGFAEMEFSPCLTTCIEHLELDVKLICGKVSVSISQREQNYRCILTVPAGVTCRLKLAGNLTLDGQPCTSDTSVLSGTHEILVSTL